MEKGAYEEKMYKNKKWLEFNYFSNISSIPTEIVFSANFFCFSLLKFTLEIIVLKEQVNNEAYPLILSHPCSGQALIYKIQQGLFVT